MVKNIQQESKGKQEETWAIFYSQKVKSEVSFYIYCQALISEKNKQLLQQCENTNLFTEKKRFFQYAWLNQRSANIWNLLQDSMLLMIIQLIHPSDFIYTCNSW